LNKESIRTGIFYILDGRPLILPEMSIQISRSNNLIVTGWTRTIHMENINRNEVMVEVETLKNNFRKFMKEFPELTDIISMNRLSVEFHFCYDDYGKAGIGICSEIDGTINWYI